MPLVKYDLPDINNLPCGVVKCRLFVDDSLPALTVPSSVPFTKIGDFVERIDADPGIVDAESVSLDIAEDYSIYPEGFWYKVINGYVNKTIVSSGSFSEPQVPASSPAYSNSIERASGSFITDGWRVGMSGAIAQTGYNDAKSFTVQAISVDGLTITTVDGLSVVSAESCVLTSEVYELDVQLMFSIMEDTTEMFLFRGSINRQETTFGEVYIQGTDKVRLLSTGLVSLLTSLSNVPTSALILENVPFTLVFGTGIFYWSLVKFSDLINTIVRFAFQEVDNSNCTVTNNSYDITAKSATDSSSWIQWTDLWFVGRGFGNYRVIPFAVSNPVGFLNPINSSSWMSRYSNAKELLSHLCKEFGCVANYSFGLSDGAISGIWSANTHNVTFSSRGHAGDMIGAVNPVGRIIKSDFISDSPVKASSFRFTELLLSKTICWLKYAQYVNGLNVPSNATFDMDETSDFFPADQITELNFIKNSLYTRAAGSISANETVSKWRWYDYQKKAYDETITSGGFFSQTTVTIDRPSGSFITDGWKVGMTGMLFQDGGNVNNTMMFRVLAVNALQIVTPEIFTAQGSGNCLLIHNCGLFEVLANYYHSRFSPKRFQYNRVYGSLKSLYYASTSIVWSKILAGHQITDVINGLTITNDFYAGTMKKNIETNTLEVEWIQE